MSERDLFCAVIRKAIDDLLPISTSGISAGTKKVIYQDAYRFLFDPAGGLDVYCYLANLHPRWIRRLARETIREANGHGPKPGRVA